MEFPVEDEWHKGKIENIIKETSERIVTVDLVKVEEYKNSFCENLKSI